MTDRGASSVSRRGSSELLRKILSPNDLGTTNSHQAGIHVPKAMVEFFPPLDEQSLNPDAWITVVDVSGQKWTWRYIHYNNRVVSGGTRNEYRLTHTRSFLEATRASARDVLELARVGPLEFSARIIEPEPEPSPESSEALVLRVAGPWRSVRI